MVYMPGRDLTLLAEEWKSEGLPADLPCVLVSCAGQPEQTVIGTTLGSLPEAPALRAPSLLLAGWALSKASLAQELSSIGVARWPRSQHL